MPREAMQASCPSGHKHAVPAKGCSCGIYAARDLDHLSTMQYHRYADDDFVVIGAVSLWGRYVAGNLGWRAEKAYPQRLQVPFEAWRIGAELRDAYGVKIELANTLALGEEVNDGD